MQPSDWGARGVYLGVPVTVIDDDSVGSSESDALSPSSCGQQKDEAVCVTCTDRHTPLCTGKIDKHPPQDITWVEECNFICNTPYAGVLDSICHTSICWCISKSCKDVEAVSLAPLMLHAKDRNAVRQLAA